MPSAPARLIDFPIGGISDGEIRLRLMSEADVPAVVEACQDADIQRFTSVPSPYREWDAVEFLARSAERRNAGAALATIIDDPQSAQVLGSIDLRREGEDPGRWSIGYAVYPNARGRGVATRALRLLSRFALLRLGAKRVEVCAEPENVASQRVAEGAGFEREGVLRDYQSVKGERRDMIMYSLLPADLS